MKVFLRSRITRLYCAESNEWSAATGQALDFTCIARATRFALAESMPGIELVLKYDMLPDEVPVPLLAQWRDFGQPDSAAA